MFIKYLEAKSEIYIYDGMNNEIQNNVHIFARTNLIFSYL